MKEKIEKINDNKAENISGGSKIGDYIKKYALLKANKMAFDGNNNMDIREYVKWECRVCG